MPSDDFGSDDEYWRRLAAKAGLPESSPRRSTKQEQKPVSIDDTDPLAIIYGALQACADATKENTEEIRALRRAVEASDNLSGRSQAMMEDYQRSILTAVNSQTAGAERIAQAEDAKYFWGVMGLLVGTILGMVLIGEIFPLLQHWL